MKRSSEEVGMPGSIPAAVDEQVAGATSDRTTDAEFIPTRTVGKTPRLPPHNPLQFVKVQSPLYIKAEQQIKLTKEVKISREASKEGEEEWQSNLDDWKSRRRKVSEKVIQRAEEMRQIEAEEQLRKDTLQRKIKKFSEIVEKKSSRSYNLDFYIGAGDDSGLGATPEPDETLECLLRSDTSEGGATSEAESVDSDSHKSEKLPEKEPPKVPQKPYAKFKRSTSLSYTNNELFHPEKGIDLNSSTEPSDVEGHAADTEATSSEEDVGPIGVTDSLTDDAQRQLDFITHEPEADSKTDRISHYQLSNEYNQTFKICLKHSDVRGFGFTLKGGKDQGSPAHIENVVKGSPAEETGLKSGDKIISINGELADDCSHASLVFSVKQALYTGILDIVINRSENCETINAETKTVEYRKGKSFAEKLAIFTAGVNTPSVDTKSKSSETKNESLVLRRRSAFENGNAESVNFMNRRLSCVTQSLNASSEKTLEKRHSVDFALSQYVTPENASNKKGPPPPVPAKPKFKTKTASFELNKPVLKANEIIPSSPCSIENSLKETQPLVVYSVSSEGEHQRTTQDCKQTSENESDEKNIPYAFDENSLLSDYELNKKANSVSSYETSLNVEEFITNDCGFDQNESSATDKHSVSFEVNALEVTKNISNANVFETVNENTLKDLGEELCEDSFNQKSDITRKMNTFSKHLANGVSSEHFDKRSTTEDPQYSLDNCADNISKEIDAEVTIIPSACDSAFCNEDNNASITESQYIQSLEDSETVEYKNDNDTNSSLLCLSLEKIDEDDVISASTTTSSDTPDTETVIETLPSNVSPLPNDESNSEDFSKILNVPDEKPSGICSSSVMFSSEINDGRHTSQNYDEVVETTEDCLEDYSNFVSNNMDKSYYEDQQNEEYAHELDESLDQITSLDIIDRIEQSLMDQLQKEDSYEDPLERDPWLYYSEESELIEDLTPRNLEPPRDPPPPPPPPELDNKIMPISRTNSTKRIKKELLRRRSDFLGLQSPEAFHVDSIPPPPPLLEDLLKQQTQWLEKPSQAHIEMSPISCKSTCVVLKNYSNNDYSDYFEEENIESPKENEPEQLKSNRVDESILDGSYGLHSETVIGNAKLCESPHHKAKQNIQNLGAAPKAKIMDSTQWITDKDTNDSQMSCNLNGSRTTRRYSMPPLRSDTPPDVTVRTWGDREYDYIQHRPASAIYRRPCLDGNKDRQSFDLSNETELEVHKCSCCGKGLCEGSAMGIEALRLYFHIECFRCCFCSIQLGNGSCGTDVQVKNNQLYCPSCFTVD